MALKPDESRRNAGLPHRFPLRLGAVAVLAGLAGSLAAAPPAAAQNYNRQWTHEDPFRDPKRTLQQRRDQRRMIQDALRARLESEFHTAAPYVSDQTIGALQSAISRYRAIVQAGGWPKVPENQTLRRNDSGEAVRALRRRLSITGDVRGSAPRSWRFDTDLELAVARFQLRHGLRLSGFVDSRTRRALNVPARQRLHQLRTNLARLTELKKINKDQRYVIVNVPSFQLQAVQDGQLALRSNVVVGKPSRATPSVSAKIKELNFYPYWRVPDSIAHRDLIPQIRRDPSYFFKEGFSLLPRWGADPIEPSQIDWMSPKVRGYKFRQDPGPRNALGVVRLNMPNKHIVYLHDTPLKRLFGHNARAFSSGCVRVERVLDLASWLLQGTPEWDPLRVQVTVAQGQPQDVKLKKPVPVHFVYVTAWATGPGTAHFRRDIYGRDGSAVEVADSGEELPQEASAITP